MSRLNAQEVRAIADSAVPDTDVDPSHRTWQAVDLTSVLDGTWEPLQPTVARRADGQGMFYSGKCHTVVSETEAGKTWLALSACLDEMQDGNHVLYLDFEDDAGGVIGRLLTLGAHRDLIRTHFHYLRPDTPIGTGVHRDDLRTLVQQHRPTLAVLDGITEAMTLHGLNPNSNDDAATFNNLLPRPIAKTGAAVVSLDHVTKDRESRGKYALGAAHKLNALDGAQYLLENRSVFGIGLTGRSTIKIAKDRPAQLRKASQPTGQGLYWFGDLVLESHAEEFAEVSIEPPHERDENWRPHHVMGRVARALTQHGPLSQRKIIAAVGGKRQTAINALNFLILDGYVSEETPHELVKPYEHDGENP